MKKNALIPSSLAFILTLTVFVIGCGREPVPPAAPAPVAPGDSTAPAGIPASPGVTTEDAYVQPMTPRTVTMALATPAAKIAAEKVPLPPVADLEGQVETYIKKLDGDLEDLASTKNFKADSGSLLRDSNALALIALGIGLAEEEGKLKKAAPGIVAAAQAVGKAEDLAAAQKAVADVKTALTGSGDPTTLGWTKVAALAPVMKAVPNISSNVTRNSSTERRLSTGARMKDARAAVLEGTAAMAVIVQGSMANYEETNKAGSAADWERLCKEFRDLALKANAEAHNFVDGKSDFATLSTALETMRKSCDDCHNVFHKAAIGQQ